jgi:hypothetical protein
MLVRYKHSRLFVCSIDSVECQNFFSGAPASIINYRDEEKKSFFISPWHLSLAPHHLLVADAPDAQPAHVFGVRYSGNRHIPAVRLVAAEICAFQAGTSGTDKFRENG